MSHTRPYLLVDTNIWLDYFNPRRPQHAEAVRFIELAYKHDAQLLYAVSSSKDIFYLFSKALKDLLILDKKLPLSTADAQAINAMTWDAIEDLNKLATPVACDIADVWLAQKYSSLHSDYEDNLIIAAAQRAKADYLVTNDEKLLRHCPVACADIHDAISFIAIEAER